MPRLRSAGQEKGQAAARSLQNETLVAQPVSPTMNGLNKSFLKHPHKRVENPIENANFNQ
jgi:hypothetical protein